MNSIKWIENKMPRTEDKELEIMALCNVKAARAFHESFPQYKVTPLAELKELAKLYGIDKLCVKDESYRFGLNAFKVLGGSFAMARYISKLTGRSTPFRSSFRPEAASTNRGAETRRRRRLPHRVSSKTRLSRPMAFWVS